MKIQVAFILFLCTLTSVAFMNCSQEGFKGATGKINNGGVNVSGGYETADMSGNIPAYQDLQFRFKIPGFVSGATLTASGLPAWLTLDTANGELVGAPPAAATHTGINVTMTNAGASKTYGPYTITVTGDAIKSLQWHLQNTGQSVYSATPPVAGEDMHMTEAVRSRALGQDIKIAVSDTGIQQSHPGLAPNMIANASRNYLNNYAQTNSWLGDSSPADTTATNAHGTAVAGLIAESGWDGGARGMAPMAKIAGFLFVQAQSQLAANGLYSAGVLDQYTGNFDIFNYSWGDVQCAMTEYDQAFRDKLKAGASLRGGRGAIYLRAAGNDFVGASQTCYSTAAANAYFLGNANFSEDSVSPYLILVGAVNAAGKVSSYSTPGANLWISATGGEYGLKSSANNIAAELQPAMVTSDFVGCNKGVKTLKPGLNDFNGGAGLNSGCDHVATMNGTSSASPVSAGAVAMMLSVNPALTWRDVKHILAVTADVVDANAGNTIHPGGTAMNPAGHVYQQGWVTNAAGIKFHNWYGFGRINVDKAVAMARTYVSQLGTFKETNNGAAFKYNSGNINMALNGGTVTGASSTLSVTENYKIESVVIRAAVNNCAGAVGLELTSPSGTKSIVMNINSQLLDTAIESHQFMVNAFYNENSAGTWTLKAINPRAGCNATFQNWQLNVYGH